jgi:hypothetical protein
MARALAALLVAGSIVATVACTTTRVRENAGYVICNDLDANVTCPDNTANVVVGM